MRKIFLPMAACSLLTLLSCGGGQKPHEAPITKDSLVAAAPEPAKKEVAELDSAARAKAWENYMTPGEMHKWLASMDGKWSSEVVFWEGPDSAPSPVSKSTVENKTVMGGRYQESVHRGDMMGMPFEGHSTMAYDNSTKMFISTWIDNWGTGIMVMKGSYDEGTKTLNMRGTSYDPSTGQECEIREETKFIDDKTQLMTMYGNKNGKEFKTMEAKMTRK